MRKKKEPVMKTYICDGCSVEFQRVEYSNYFKLGPTKHFHSIDCSRKHIARIFGRSY